MIMSEFIISFCVVEHSQPRIIWFVIFPFKSFESLSIVLKNLFEARQTNIYLISIIVRGRSTSQTDHPCFTNLSRTTTTTVAPVTVPLNVLQIFRLDVFTEFLLFNSWPFSCQQDRVIFVSIMLSFFCRLSLHTLSATEFVSFFPLKPIVRES